MLDHKKLSNFVFSIGLLCFSSGCDDGGADGSASAGAVNGNYIKIGGAGNEVSIISKALSDGGLVVAGHSDTIGASGTTDIWIFKLSGENSLEWQMVFANNQGNDSPYDVIETSDGGVLMVGKGSFNSGQAADFWVVKFSSAGSVEWQKIYYQNSQDEVALAAAETDDGDYIVAGGRWIIKVSNVGNLIWQKFLTHADSPTLQKLVKTSDGAFVLAGQIRGSTFTPKENWIMKIDKDSTILWQRRITGKWITGNVNGSVGGMIVGGLIPNSSGGVYLSGLLNATMIAITPGFYGEIRGTDGVYLNWYDYSLTPDNGFYPQSFQALASNGFGIAGPCSLDSCLGQISSDLGNLTVQNIVGLDEFDVVSYGQIGSGAKFLVGTATEGAQTDIAILKSTNLTDFSTISYANQNVSLVENLAPNAYALTISLVDSTGVAADGPATPTPTSLSLRAEQK